MADVNGPGSAAGSSQVTVDEQVDAEGTVTLTISGELDLSGEASLRDLLADVERRTPPKIVLRLAGVTFLDSSGLAVLLRVAQSAQAVQLPDPSDVVRRVIRISGLQEVLPMTPP